ncbi:MAG: DUF4349 domain-containing protein [Clostridia bacterium]|nr:DUF4349 domain-containing protein [Clostridia bacterium]
MKKAFLAFFAIFTAAALLAFGCASPKNTGSSDYFRAPIDEKSPYYGISTSAPDAANELILSENEQGESTAQMPAGRKIIRNAYLSVQTLEFDPLISALNERLFALGGYIESNSIEGRGYNSSSLRYANMVLRVPADRLDEFLTSLEGICHITERSENASDVTGRYVDVEAHIASLQTEYNTLLELLSKAESLDNIIVLQERLSDVRYQLESYEAQKLAYDESIAYSTVKLDIREVERETVVEKESFGAEIGRRFSESLSDIGSGFKSFAAWLLGESPRILITLAVIAAIAFAIALIARKLRGTSNARVGRASKAGSGKAELPPDGTEDD